jgi:hypothetical protein
VPSLFSLVGHELEVCGRACLRPQAVDVAGAFLMAAPSDVRRRHRAAGAPRFGADGNASRRAWFSAEQHSVANLGDLRLVARTWVPASFRSLEASTPARDRPASVRLDSSRAERCSANITPPDQAGEESPPEVATSGRPTVDEMGEWSFPASDPPAIWTWDPVQGVDNG